MAQSRPTSSSIPSPTLNIINAEISSNFHEKTGSSEIRPPETEVKSKIILLENPVDSRAIELANLEEERRLREDRERKNKQQMEQEQKFREKMRIEQRYYFNDFFSQLFRENKLQHQIGFFVKKKKLKNFSV